MSDTTDSTTIGENQLGADEFEVEPYEGYRVLSDRNICTAEEVN